jgi:hypothetical protein
MGDLPDCLSVKHNTLHGEDEEQPNKCDVVVFTDDFHRDYDIGRNALTSDSTVLLSDRRIDCEREYPLRYVKEVFSGVSTEHVDTSIAERELPPSLVDVDEDLLNGIDAAEEVVEYLYGDD